MKVPTNNNAIAYLELDEDISYFHDILNFLIRSPIFHAIHDNPVMDKKVLHKLWQSATVEGSSTIVFSYKEAQYRFTSNDVADALSLPRDTGKAEYSRESLRLQFAAIGLQGEFKATIKKSSLPPKWRVIAEVILRCFSSKAGGWNEINQTYQQLFYSLITGQEFDYAQYVFVALRKQILFNTAHPDSAASIYSRFIILILQHTMGSAYPPLCQSRIIEADKLTNHFYKLMVKKELPASPADPPLTPYMASLLQQQAQVRSSSSPLPSFSPPPSPHSSSLPTMSVRPDEPDQAQPADSPPCHPYPLPPPKENAQKHLPHLHEFSQPNVQPPYPQLSLLCLSQNSQQTLPHSSADPKGSGQRLSAVLLWFLKPLP